MITSNHMAKDMNSNVKVSIVVPIYNVEKYLRECLDSIMNQTLKDIEIICVNDGSTDSSPEIIKEYLEKDQRFKCIDKPNTGYGNSMNRGFDLACGEYIGIVESDDFVDPEMFETLYNIAHNDNLDAVKSGFYYYYSKPKVKNVKEVIVSDILERKTICPREDFKAKKEMVDFFNIKPTIWSAIYKKDFIRQNNICFNETPGASYQDASFNFKVWACANRVQLISEAFLHYRQDNENSSVNSKAKVFCVCDEYEEMERFLRKNPLYYGKLENVKNRIKYDTYMWNYDRLGEKYKYVFIERASHEFQEDFKEGNLDAEYFESYKWNDLMKLIEDPIEYHTNKSLGKQCFYLNTKEYEKIVMSKAYRFAQKIVIISNKFQGGIQCFKDHGTIYTFFYGIKKVLAHVLRRNKK